MAGPQAALRAAWGHFWGCAQKWVPPQMGTPLGAPFWDTPLGYPQNVGLQGEQLVRPDSQGTHSGFPPTSQMHQAVHFPFDPFWGAPFQV